MVSAGHVVVHVVQVLISIIIPCLGELLMRHKLCQNNEVFLDFSTCMSHPGILDDLLVFGISVAA